MPSNLKIGEQEPSFAKVATGGVLWKKIFLKTSQISLENTCDGISF